MERLKLALSLASVLTLCACGTLKPLPDVPRPLPVEAMQPESADLCRLKPEIVDASIAEALSQILLCRAMDAEQYRRLERKHRELAEWIKSP